MTEDTKKTFCAPWRVEEHKEVAYFSVIDADGRPFSADIPYREDATRIASLPELYDALLQATEDACRTCNHEKAEGILDRPCNDLHSNECYVAEWRELLRKVRDGE